MPISAATTAAARDDATSLAQYYRLLERGVTSPKLAYAGCEVLARRYPARASEIATVVANRVTIVGT